MLNAPMKSLRCYRLTRLDDVIGWILVLAEVEDGKTTETPWRDIL